MWSFVFYNIKRYEGEDTYREDTYGEDTYGEDTYGEDTYGEDTYGEDTYGEDTYGEDTRDKRYKLSFLKNVLVYLRTLYMTIR